MTTPPPFPWNRMAILFVLALAVVGGHIYLDVRKYGTFQAASIFASVFTMAVVAGIIWLLHYLWTRRS
jgi:hypothetical protein